MREELMCNKKIIVCIIIFISTLFIISYFSSVQAGHISDSIDEIDDAKYPRL